MRACLRVNTRTHARACTYTNFEICAIIYGINFIKDFIIITEKLKILKKLIFKNLQKIRKNWTIGKKI